MRYRTQLYLALGLLLAAPAWAVSDATDPYGSYRQQWDYDENHEVPWVESETGIEALPKDEDLSHLVTSRMPQGIELYADLENLTVGEEDLVTRAWFVARSKRGGYNGTYEGFRCATGEYKIYAYGNPSRSKPLREVKFPRWREVRAASYREDLMRDYLCNGTRPKTPHQVRSTTPPSPGNYESPYGNF